MSVKIYAMYNNKGGVGKTTLGFNIATQYADENPKYASLSHRFMSAGKHLSVFAGRR